MLNTKSKIISSLILGRSQSGHAGMLLIHFLVNEDFFSEFLVRWYF
jgi:hypothetical protein